MSVFHGNWNEDPKEFLNSYLQCTAAGGASFRARQFINYLGVYSDADEWYDELPHEEKEDWAAIECSFRKRWLKEEVPSIKETVTIENEPQVSLHSPKIIQNHVSMPHTPSNTSTTSPSMTSCVSTKSKTTVAMSQMPPPLGNGKKLENNQFKRNYCENSSVVPIFSSPTLRL